MRKFILTNFYTKKPIVITNYCPSCGEKWKWHNEDINKSFIPTGQPWWRDGGWYSTCLINPHGKITLVCPKCHYCEIIEYSDFEIVDE